VCRHNKGMRELVCLFVQQISSSSSSSVHEGSLNRRHRIHCQAQSTTSSSSQKLYRLEDQKPIVASYSSIEGIVFIAKLNPPKALSTEGIVIIAKRSPQHRLHN
ncbi:unnamed protein product, partial [Ilex paraguariensis]